MKTKNTLLVIGCIFLGLFMGWVFFGGNSSNHQHVQSVAKEKENTVYTCVMHPQIKKNEPGKCPICGMELVPLEKEKVDANPAAVHLSEYARTLANVQTYTVGSQAAAVNKIRLSGKVTVAEQLAYSQSTHVPGRIEELFVDFTGEKINKGQALARIYSPKLVTAQEELLQAYSVKESNPRLFEAAKQKLLNWKIGKNQIEHILKRGKPIERFVITADVSGIVTQKMIKSGDHVKRGTVIYKIANLNKVWILFNVYESGMSWVEEGDTIEFTIAALPGKTFKGKIGFITPTINPQTRVATARVVVENKDNRLKPGMLVTGTLKAPLGESTNNKITIPKSAVLWTGKRSVVYVKQASGTYELRKVLLGPALGDNYVINKGLEQGEEIVVNGAFVVDAAAQLAGKPSMMNSQKNQ